MPVIVGALKRLRLTVELVASKCDLTNSRIQDIFDGASATSSELRSLARGLKVPLRSLAIANVQDSTNIGLRFRNTKATDDAFDPTSERIAAFLEAAIRVLPKRFEPAEWLVRLWEKPHGSLHDAEIAAALVRDMLYYSRLEPAIGLPQRLNSLDGIVVSQLPRSQYEGASVFWEGYVFIFVSPRFVGRMLFTLGHELGHVVAHHSKNLPHYDRPGDIGRFRSTEEGYADAFAAAFLLPEEGVAQVLSAVRSRFNINADQIGDVELLYLSHFFGVSFDVAARRCERLNLLPFGGGSSIAERLRKDFGSPERRASALGIPKIQATQIDQVAAKIVAAASGEFISGRLSPTWVSERLGLSTEQLQAIYSELRQRAPVVN